jgi:hypothetical protein
VSRLSVAWKEFQRQLPTPEQLREWGRRFNPKRWGLVTGELAGVVVVDFDGVEGIKWMQEWGINPHRRTGSGGFHCYVQHPDWKVPTLNAKASKRSWPWPGLDIRGDGGFAVVLGRNGNGPYVQLRELEPEPFEALPEEVRTFLRAHSQQEDAPPKPPARTQQPTTGNGNSVGRERLIRMALEMAPANGRNNAGFWLACQLRDNGYDFREAEAAMRDYQSRVRSTNAKGHRELYTQSEVMATLRQAYSRSSREPWAKSSRPHNGSVLASAPSRQHGRRGEGDAPGRQSKALHVSDADGSESIYLYVGHTGEPLVGHTGEPLSSEHYSRIPRKVSGDRRLKHRDRCVYAVLAGFCWQGNTARVGKRLIARLAHCAERLVIDSLRRLESTGHICKDPRWRPGQRMTYLLASSVFGQKQRAGVEEAVTPPGGQPRLVTVRKDQRTAWTM